MFHVELLRVRGPVIPAVLALATDDGVRPWLAPKRLEKSQAVPDEPWISAASCSVCVCSRTTARSAGGALAMDCSLRDLQTIPHVPSLFGNCFLNQPDISSAVIYGGAVRHNLTYPALRFGAGNLASLSHVTAER